MRWWGRDQEGIMFPKMREITLYLYANRNDAVERGEIGEAQFTLNCILPQPVRAGVIFVFFFVLPLFSKLSSMNIY